MSALHITTHTKGKLEGIPSINCSTRTNAFCISTRLVPGSVCSKCYARQVSALRKSLEAHLVENSKLLARWPLAGGVPRLSAPYVRFHSFGELQNADHAYNLRDIARANPRTTFVLWTKRPELLCVMPPNVTLVYSEPVIDGPEEPHKGFHHTYVVRSHGEPCGAACLDCLKCWRKSGPHVVRQLLH